MSRAGLGQRRSPIHIAHERAADPQPQPALFQSRRFRHEPRHRLSHLAESDQPDVDGAQRRRPDGIRGPGRRPAPLDPSSAPLRGQRPHNRPVAHSPGHNTADIGHPPRRRRVTPRPKTSNRDWGEIRRAWQPEHRDLSLPPSTGAGFSTLASWSQVAVVSSGPFPRPLSIKRCRTCVATFNQRMSMCGCRVKRQRGEGALGMGATGALGALGALGARCDGCTGALEPGASGALGTRCEVHGCGQCARATGGCGCTERRGVRT